MTLTLAKVDFEHCGFTNAQYTDLKPLIAEKSLHDLVNGPMPAVQIDGQKISDIPAVCRYIGQTRGLYPDPTDAKAVVKIENLIAGAETLFNALITHHYNSYTKKAGVKL